MKFIFVNLNLDLYPPHSTNNYIYRVIIVLNNTIKVC